MAHVVAIQTGNWSAASTWGGQANTPTISSSTNVSINTTGIYTQSFTSTATDDIVGVMVYPVSSWAGKTITFTLQADGVDTATTVAIDGGDIKTNQPLFVKLASAYTQTIGVVYRFRVSTNTSTATVARESSGSDIAAIIVDDQGAVPVSGDSVYICAPNADTDLTVTVDNTSAVCGNNAVASGAGAFATSNRYWDMALQISGGDTAVAKLAYATGVDTDLNIRNSVWVSGNGKIEQKPTSGVTSDTTLTPGSTLSLKLFVNFGTDSLHDIQGAGMTTEANWKSIFVGGVGTAADPVEITSGTGSEWSVGDYLVFHPTSDSSTNYNQVEYRYIISKPTDDTMVLSDTAGGSELALSYTHTGGYVFNDFVGKNVRWTSSDGYYWHMILGNSNATTTDSILRWVTLRQIFSSGSSARGGLAPSAGAPLVEYISFGVPGVQGASQVMYIPSNNANAMTFKGLFTYSNTTANHGDGVINNTAILKTFEDCWIVYPRKRGWVLRAGGTLNRCGVIANTGAIPTLYCGFSVEASGLVFNDCEAHANNDAGFMLYPGGADIELVRYLSGTKGANGETIRQSSSSVGYNTIYFDTPQINDTAIVVDNTLMLEGSEIVMSNINSTEYNNVKYTRNGEARITGAGLDDTTTPPLGTYAYRQDPDTETGIKYRFRQVASANANFLTYGKVWCNAAFLADSGCTITVDLYMPGSVEGADTPDASVTMTKTTDKTSENAQFNLSSFYSGSIPSNAIIVITATNTNAVSNAYIYVGDLLNAENDVTKFELMFRGEPNYLMPETAGESGAIATAVESALSALIAASVDWTDDEKAQIRHALGIDGSKTDSASGVINEIALTTEDTNGVVSGT